MDQSKLLEPEVKVFTGTVRFWREGYGELVTDSGVTIPLITQGHPQLREGSRATVSVRKMRPLYQIERVDPAG